MDASRSMSGVTPPGFQQTPTAHKVNLTWATLVVGIVAFGVQLAVVERALRPYDDGNYYERPWISPESLALIGLSLIWNIADMTMRFWKHRGIHSGAHVGLHLILWMGLLSAALVQILINFWDGVAVAAGTTKIILCILHFTLFVYACIDTDRRRRLEDAEALVKAVAATQEGQQFELAIRASPSNVPTGTA